MYVCRPIPCMAMGIHLFVYIFPVVGVNMQRQFYRENSEVKRVKLAKKAKGQLTWQWNGKTPYLESEIHLQMVHVIIAMLGCTILSRTFDTFCLFIINLSKTSQGGFPHLPFKVFFEKKTKTTTNLCDLFSRKKNICFRKAKYLDVASIPKH